MSESLTILSLPREVQGLIYDQFYPKNARFVMSLRAQVLSNISAPSVRVRWENVHGSVQSTFPVALLRVCKQTRVFAQNVMTKNTRGAFSIPPTFHAAHLPQHLCALVDEVIVPEEVTTTDGYDYSSIFPRLRTFTIEKIFDHSHLHDEAAFGMMSSGNDPISRNFQLLATFDPNTPENLSVDDFRRLVAQTQELIRGNRAATEEEEHEYHSDSEPARPSTQREAVASLLESFTACMRTAETDNHANVVDERDHDDDRDDDVDEDGTDEGDAGYDDLCEAAAEVKALMRDVFPPSWMTMRGSVRNKDGDLIEIRTCHETAVLHHCPSNCVSTTKVVLGHEWNTGKSVVVSVSEDVNSCE